MKKIFLIICILFIITIPVYADVDDDRYSEWSTIQTNYPLEQSKTEYGYLYPIEWSSWSTVDPDDPYTKSEYRPYPSTIPDSKKTWTTTSRQVLYSWPERGEYETPRKLLYWYIDIDAYDNRDYSISKYYEPKMELTCTLETNENIVVGRTPGRGGNEHNMSINMEGDGNYVCKKVTLTQVEDIPRSGNYASINRLSTVYSYVSFETLCYSHVIKWSEGTGWRDTPYENRYGDDPIIAVERTVYRHPLYYLIDYELYGGSFDGDYPKKYYPENGIELKEPYKKGYEFIGFHLLEDLSDPIITNIPKGYRGDITLFAEYKRIAPIIDVDERYIYEEDDIEDIKDLAHAEDELDGDITEDIIIKNITYDDTGESVDYPESFDSSKSNTIHVTYEVTNSNGITETKTVKLYILKEGRIIDLKLYDRYISRDYLNTLENNSLWKVNEYEEALMAAIDWIERS